MNQNHHNSIDQKKGINSTSADSGALSPSSLTTSATAGFVPSVGQISDPASVARDVLLLVNGHHIQVSRHLATYYHRRKGWLDRFFPTALDSVLADSQLRQAKTDCELNERLLALATQMKFDACREVGEAWVKSLRVGVREQFIAFVTERFQNLKYTIETRRVEFGRYMRDRYRTWESYHDVPELADRYKTSMDREIEQYFEWLDGLLSGFRSIIDEKLGEYNRDPLPPS